MGKVIYIAGAMNGSPQYAVDFEAAEEAIKSYGFIALNPTKLPKGMSDKQYSQIYTAMIHSADAVLLLKSWPADKDATFAKKLAEYTGKLISSRLDVLVAVLLEL